MGLVQLRNETAYDQPVNDLGIWLLSGEDLYLDDNYTEEELIGSVDLKNSVNNDNLSIYIEGVKSSYNEFYLFIKKINIHEHNTLPTVVHVNTDPSFMEVLRDLNGQAEHIHYWKDSTKQVKIRDEEIFRDSEGRVDYVDIYEFDLDGSPLRSRREVYTRNSSGYIESTNLGAKP